MKRTAMKKRTAPVKRSIPVSLPLLLALLVTAVSLLSASPARAQTAIAVPDQDTGGTELTLVVGALFDDSSADQGTLAITGPAQTRALYGARLGSYGRWLGLELGVEYSKGGLNWSTFDGLLTSQVRALYAEGNVVVSFLPGMVRPFVTGGVGLHSFELVDIAGRSEHAFGWNVGGGVRVVHGMLVFRGELRDHVTKLEPDSFGLGLEDIIAVDESFTVHNVALTGGIGLRF